MKQHAPEFYNKGVKLIAFLLLIAGLATPYEREGNFWIRFEPMAVLQAACQFRFTSKWRIHGISHLNNAKVTLQIETSEHNRGAKVQGHGNWTPAIYSRSPCFPKLASGLVDGGSTPGRRKSAHEAITFEVANPQN